MIKVLQKAYDEHIDQMGIRQVSEWLCQDTHFQHVATHTTGPTKFDHKAFVSLNFL